jgi:hypothetical protein
MFSHTRLAIAAGLLLGSRSIRAQSPFLFANQPPNVVRRLITSVDAGYNARAFEPVAGERLEPRATLVGVLSPLFSVQGQLAAASTIDHRTRLSDQLELMVTPVRTGAFALGSALGFRHEYSGADVALARVVAARTTSGSAMAADVLFEHPFVPGRDAVDVITTIGAARELTQRVWLGIEAVGSDLEGLWDSEEAEGGATLLIGPTLALAPSDRWRLVVGGGPVIRATTDKTINALGSRPSLGAPSGQAGYVVRLSLRRVW